MSKIKKLYDIVSEKYDFGDYNTFESYMNDSEKRRKVYDIISEKYDFGDYDNFNNMVGSAPSAPSAPSAEEVAESMQPEEANKFGVLGRMGKYMGSPSAYAPMPEIKESEPITDEQRAAQAQMREQLKESGVIDTMEDMKKDARRAKWQSMGTMLAYTPSVSMYGVSSNVFKDTDEQLAELDAAMSAGAEYTQNKAMQQTLDEALDMARQGEINMDDGTGIGNFLRGVWDEASRMSTWDMGYSDVVNNLTINQVVQKWQNGEELSATEKSVIDALGMAAAVQEAYAGTTGIGYAVGQSAPHSAAFMATMAINPASGLGKSLAKQTVRRVGRQGVKAAIARGAARAGGDILETAIMTGTVGLGRVSADALERINGSSEYYVSPEGYIMYGGQKDQEDVAKAWFKAFGTSFVEGYTEALGSAVFDPALDALKGVVRGGVKKGAINQMGEAILNVEPSRLATAMRGIKQAAKIDSMVGELLEEEVGMMLNWWDNAWTKEAAERDGKTYIFDLENQLTTLISTCLMTGAINGAEAAGNWNTKRKINNEAEKADLRGKAVFGEGWATYRDKVDNATPEEVVDALRDAFLDPTMTHEKKRALINYASRRITAQYYNAEEAAARRGLLKEEQQLQDAFEAGYNSYLPAFYNMRKAADEATKNLQEYAEANGRTEAIIAAINESMSNPAQMRDIVGQLPEQEQQLVYDYIYSNARMQGAYQGRSDQLEDYVDEFAFSLEPFVRTDESGNRTITTANIRHGDKLEPVYVVANDGTNAYIMRPDGSSTKEPILVKDLENMVTRNAEDVIEMFRQQATQTSEAETEEATTYREGVQEPVVGMQLHRGGDVVEVIAVNGDQVQIVQTKYNPKTQKMEPVKGTPETITIAEAKQLQNDYIENEEARQSFAKGTEHTLYINGEAVKGEIAEVDADGNYVVHLDRYVDGYGQAPQFKLDELRRLTTPPTISDVSADEAQNESAPTEQIEQSVSEEIAESKNEPTEEVKENVSEPTAEVADNVNTPQMKAAELLNAELEADEIDDNIAYNTQAAIDAADKKLKKKPTMKDAKGDVAVYKALKAQWQAELNELQKIVAYWNEVAKEVAAQREAAEAMKPQNRVIPSMPVVATGEGEKLEKKMEKATIAQMVKEIGEPQSIGEYVMMALASKPRQLRWSDKENGTKGFGSHTGLSQKERQLRNEMISDEHGLTPEEFAHAIVENMDASFGEVDVMDVTDMVIDYVSSHTTRKDMLRSIIKSRADMLRAQEADMQEQADAWYVEQYHATEGELNAYNEWLDEETILNVADEAAYNERIINFAEQIADNGNERTDEGVLPPVSEREGADAVGDRGSSVGESEQADNSGAVLGDVEGRATADNAEADQDVREESDVEAWEAITKQRIEELEEEIADLENGIAELEDSIEASESEVERESLEDAIVSMQTRLKEAEAERDGLMGLAEESESVKGVWNSEGKATANEVASKSVQAAIDEYTKQNPWEKDLSEKERADLEILRSAEGWKIDFAYRQLQDIVASGKAKESDKRRIALIQKYRASGEREFVESSFGVKLEEPMSLESLEELFAKWNTDEKVAELFDRLIPIMRDLGMQFSFSKSNIYGEEWGLVEGQYSLADNAIKYSSQILSTGRYSDQYKATVIVHEMIHAVTTYAIASKTDNQWLNVPKKVADAAQSIINIYKAVKDNPIFTDEYGITNEAEFVAELANPEFRDKLKQIDVKGKNAWQRFLDVLKRLINKFSDIYDVTAYGKAVDALETLMDNFNREAYDVARDNIEIEPQAKVVTDKATIEALEASPKVKAYRAMQIIDGELYPPMSAVVDGKLREPSKLGQWEQAEENPELADKNGKFKLNKGNKKGVPAAYNPYIHSSTTPLNDQFAEAQDRPNLVTVEVEIPQSEADGTSGYKAEKAKDAVGKHDWKAGVIQGQLTGKREVFLSRWDKLIRIVPDSEVADKIIEMFDGKNIVMPSNVVTPSLRAELEARGVEFVETDNQGYIKEGENKGVTYSSVYGKKAKKKSAKEIEAERLDAEYMDAVNSGNMEKAQQMVSEAASKAMRKTKVVDKDKQPMLMSHHTDAEGFYVFDRGRIGTGQGQSFLGAGFNFSRGSGSSVYGSRNIQAYLDARKPLRSDRNTLSVYQIEQIIKELNDISGDQIEYNFADNISKAARSLYEYGGDLDTYASLCTAYSGETREVLEVFEKLGFDSTIECGDDKRIKNAVVFNSNQIKSADPVTYDDNGNVIPLSKRFNLKEEDIRFQKGEAMENATPEQQLATDAALQALQNAGVKVNIATQEDIDAITSNAQAEELTDSKGEVYGWTVNGEIYLTKKGLNPETPVHEYTHMWATAMMQGNPKQWENIKNMLKDSPVWNEVLNDEGYADIRDNEDKVASEVLSRISGKNGAQKMTEMAKQMMAEAKGDTFKMAEAQSLINRMKNALKEFWGWIADALGIDYKSVEEVADKVLDDLMSGVNPVERLRENVGNVDALKGDVQFAVQHVLKGEEREQAIKDLMKVTGRSRKVVENWIKAEESLASVILQEDNLALLDLEADESLPSVWKNSDYPQGTVEFSNICRKRLPFTTIYQRLQKEFPNTVFDATTLNTIRETMKQNGEEVACGLCFVEDRRQLLGEIGQGFIDAVQGKDVKLNDKQKEALARLKESGDTYVPNLFDLLTLDGMKALRKSHPEVARAFVDYNNARGMQSGRLFMAYSAYNREILKYSDAKVKSINENGGLRVFSFSDFEAHHLIDLVQVISDCAARGIKIQGYTKVPEFAKAVKDTGAKINRSLIAKGKGFVDADYVPQKGEAVSPNVIDGKRLLFDTVEGIDVNDPNFFDASESKSVGNILVAINEEHARLAMLDPFVDYIIGFHSGQSKKQLEGKGIADWHNYKNEQLEKVEFVDENGNARLKNAPDHGINIYTDVLIPAENEGKPIKNKKQFVERFLKVCEERGFIPRFASYLYKKNGKYVYTEGYHKFLIDFKLFDENGRILPQEAVLPIFDDEFNKQILEDYVKDTKEQLPNDEVYNAVREELVRQGVLFRDGEGEKELVAVHNISEDNLRKVLEMGGLVMPSIAIYKSGADYSGFGDISLVFDKSTIDPSDERNKVYGGDAWTPTFPRMYPKINEDAASEVKDKVLGIITDKEIQDMYSLAQEMLIPNIDASIARGGIESYYAKDWMKLAYMLDSGMEVDIPRETVYYDPDAKSVIDIANKMGISLAEANGNIEEVYSNNPDFVAAIKKASDERRIAATEESRRDDKRKSLESKEMELPTFSRMIHYAYVMERDLANGGLRQVVNRQKLSDLIRGKVDSNDSEYNQWVKSLFEGVVEKYGLRNEEDWLNPSGDVRAWEELYDDVTPANILKHMLAQKEQGGGGGVFNSNLFGASRESYGSVEEIRQRGKERIGTRPTEEYDEWAEGVMTRLDAICNDCLTTSQRLDYGTRIDVKKDIIDAVAKDKGANGIYEAMQGKYPKFTKEHARQVEELVNEIKESTISYFEAKPRRIVPVTEVAAAIIPTGTNDSVVEALKGMGVEVVFYENGNEDARSRAIDSVSSSMSLKFREGEGEISDKEVSYQNDPIAKWMGKPRYYGKKASAFAERERGRMVQAVNEVAESLGLKVEVVTDASKASESAQRLMREHKKAKGWYNTSTEEIVVVVPNHVSAWDAVQTVLHEGIAHHGLRNLFGEKLDVVLDNIYNNVAPELKAKIDAIATERKLDTRTATEEYLASLAEDTNFEQAQKMGWWAKIKEAFVKLFNRLARTNAQFAEALTDNELRYILWSSYRKMTQRVQTPTQKIEDAQMQMELKVGNYALEGKSGDMVAAEPSEFTEEEQEIIAKAKADGTYMKAPNGKKSNLTPKQWAQVRTKAFIKWFGDWINDPKNASKIVDENGEPRVVYHGTNSIFTEFSKEYSGKNTDHNASNEDYAKTAHIGHWLNSERDNLHFYNHVIDAFVAIKEPLYFNSLEGLADELSYYETAEDFVEMLKNEGYDGVVINDEEIGGVSYCALSPNQIKSATENNGEFSESDDIRFRFIGEKGAESLDRYEEATTRLDNLKVAKAMEAEAKDAKTIKMATGWEKGADGLWRYETEDIELNGLDWMDSRKKLTLRDIVADDELFVAYPKLADIKIKKGRSNGGGSFDGTTIEVGLGYAKFFKEKWPESAERIIKETLVHEIQHAIQSEEGFARGGNSKQLANGADTSEYEELSEQFDAKAREYNAMHAYDRLTPKGMQLRKEALDLRKKMNAAKKRIQLGSEGYNRLAGEVEARNAERRMKMSAEERMESLAEDTEDVAREDQIFLYDAVESAMEMIKKTTVNKNTEPSQSDALSSGVISKEKGAPTVISPNAIETNANIRNKTNKAVNNIKKFNNGDLKTGVITDFADFRSALKNALGMRYQGQGVYGIYYTPNGRIALRINNHNAYGDNFIRDNASENISIYVAYKEFDVPESKIPFIEFRYSPEIFEKNKKEIFADIMQAMSVALTEGRFPQQLKYAERFEHASTPEMMTGLDEDIRFRTAEIVDEGPFSDVESDYGIRYREAEPFYSNAERAVENIKQNKATPEQGQPMFRTAEVVNEGEYLTEDKLNDIVSESEKLGVKVRVAHDKSELHPQAQKDVEGKKPIKGYYDTRTGEVVIYAPHATSANDVKRTILHEVVGHKGLRKLLGEDNFNKTMVQMYRMLPEEERKKVWDAAMRKYGDLAESMEEYLAEKAENVEKPKWWQGIVTWLKIAFKRANNVVLSDADINYLLWRGRRSLASDTPMGMAVSKMLKNAAQQSDVTKEEIAQLEEAKSRLFEKSGKLREIRERSGAAQNEYERAVQSLAFKQRESWQDSMRGLKVFQDAIAKESGKEIADYENAYMYENAMSSTNLVEMEMFHKGEYARLMESVHDLMQSGAKYEDIVNYMMAKHGLERNEKFARRDAVRDAKGDAAKEQQMYDENRNTDYAGLTALTGESDVSAAEDAAQQMVDEFEQNMPTHLVDALWYSTKACTVRTLDISHDAGIMSDAVYEELKNQFEYYIPLRGFAETTAEEVYTYVDSNDSPYNAPIKAARGRKSKADDPIATIGNMADSAILEANRNKLKQRMLYMVENHRTSLASVNSLWVEVDKVTGVAEARFADIPSDATPEEAAKLQKEFEEKMEALAQSDPKHYYKAGDKPNVPYRVTKNADLHQHQIIVKRNGKDVVITINGSPRAAQAINGLTNPERNDSRIIEWTDKLNRFLSANFTTRNPAFVVSNFARDGFYTNSMVWVKEGPAYAWQYNKNWLKVTKDIIGLVKKFKRYENGDKSALDMNDPMQRAFYEFITNGGETGYTFLKSVDAYKSIVEKEIKKLESGKASKVMSALSEGMDTFGRWAEDTSRFAAYLTSRQMGRSITKSIWDAKEISVNFNKKGSGNRMTRHDKGISRMLGGLSQFGRQAYVFWNAGMQGMFNFGSAAKRNKGKMTMLAGLAFGSGMMFAALCAWGWGDDDDEYYNLPDYVRRNNICFPLGNGRFATIPLPIELRAIYGMGELFMSWITGHEDGKEVPRKVVQQVTQVLPIDMMADGGGAMALVPSAVKPFAEVAVNVDWTGKPIYKEETPYNQYDPMWTRAYKSTSPIAVSISRAINEATNENTPEGLERPYNRGWADNKWLNNPAAWEHIYEGFLGGVGTITNQAYKTFSMLWDEDMREVRNAPVLSRFVKTAGGKNETYAIRNEYYEAKDVMDSWRREMSKANSAVVDPALSEKDAAEALALRKSLYEMYIVAKDEWDSLEKQRKELEDQYKDDPTEERRQELNDVMQRMTKIVKRVQE